VAGVREAAVIGVPDAYRGETVKAFVALKPGGSATPDQIIEFCRSKIRRETVRAQLPAMRSTRAWPA
jgi:acyl-CoA synthetase (AMP-forming)/AMP-acid ligase II